MIIQSLVCVVAHSSVNNIHLQVDFKVYMENTGIAMSCFPWETETWGKIVVGRFYGKGKIS